MKTIANTNNHSGSAVSDNKIAKSSANMIRKKNRINFCAKKRPTQLNFGGLFI